MKSEENLALYNEVRSVPDAAKSRITGGRMNGKTSIKPMWRIKMLTKQFGPCGLGWYYIPVRKWTETAGDEIAVFVDIELYVKFGGEWSKPIIGTGGSMFVSKEKNGLSSSKECYKKALTDALSVACKNLGIGADVYWDEDSDEDCPSSAECREDAEHEASLLLDDFLIKKLSAKAEKKGIKISSILQQYQKNALNELSYEEYTEIMKLLVSKPDILEERYVNSLQKELNRTGVGLNSLLRNYRKCSIQELSFEEYKDAMNKLTAKPDKPLNPAFVPPDDKGDPNSPWNQRKEKTKENQTIAPVQKAGDKAGASLSSADVKRPLPASLVEEGYTYCGSFGGS